MIKQQAGICSRSLFSGVSNFKKHLKENAPFLLMVLPGTILVILFAYLPMFGIVIAFKDIDYAKGILGSDWIGLKNFEFLFKNPDVYTVFRNTIGYNIVFIILGTLLSVASALLLSQLRNGRTAKFYQSVFMLPHFLSWITVTYVVYAFLSYRYGIINMKLMPMLGMEVADWYSNKALWPWLIIFLYIWKSIGYKSVVYIAAIAGIDQSLYEAAAIDGASRWQQAKYITIPEIMNVVVIMTILSIGSILSSDFSLFYNVPMENGNIFDVTNVISTFTYRALKVNGDMGMSAAVGLFQSVIGFILVVGTNAIVRRIDDSKALF